MLPSLSVSLLVAALLVVGLVLDLADTAHARRWRRYARAFSRAA